MFAMPRIRCRLIGSLLAAAAFAYYWAVSNHSMKLTSEDRQDTNNSSVATAQLRLWQQKLCNHGWHLLTIFQVHTRCPFMRLLQLMLIALPVYNLLLLVIGVHLHKSAKPCLQLVMEVPPQTELPAPPPSPQPPAPPRRKRKKQQAPQPPIMHRQAHVYTHPSAVEIYPSVKDPFASSLQRSREQAEQYKSLRRNLKRALEGLQKPLNPPSCSPCSQHEPIPRSPPAAVPLPTCKDKRSPKVLRLLLKRMRCSFGKHKTQLQAKSSESSGSSTDSSNAFLCPLWERLRASRKPPYRGPDLCPSSTDSSLSSSSCFYAY
ncbi:uncharacterized protein LOC115625289 [Scaptodrosophila lebanonensis]|uniref:Uncharacterized protein LOC115625289 n=1 Tax=Drosophila lebanonensis TaxID=7225 RepID=A0A6J2THJ1_DROLE|nr:uncharacterized protein LOC115625289 [Scaptodrosophila lebanonensis]